MQTPSALYAVAVVRIIFGVVLVWAAPVSRMPRTLRVIGVFIIVAGLLGPLLGVERSQAMLSWFSSQGPWFMRTWASVAIAFSLFIVHVVLSPRRA